jgi:hypothetical protein
MVGVLVAWVQSRHLSCCVCPMPLYWNFFSMHEDSSGAWRGCTTCTHLDQLVKGRLAHNISFHPSSPDSRGWQSSILDFQRCLSLEKYMPLITLCFPNVAKAEDQVADWNSIRQGDKHQPSTPPLPSSKSTVSWLAAGLGTRRAGAGLGRPGFEPILCNSCLCDLGQVTFPPLVCFPICKASVGLIELLSDWISELMN